MKPSFILSIVAVLALPLVFTGCKQDAQTDATQPLQESFRAAEPEVQKNIQTVTTSLKSGNYMEATRALEPIVTRRDLTVEQRQAIGVALRQVNQAIATDPSLDTKEMYELRNKMFNAVDR